MLQIMPNALRLFAAAFIALCIAMVLDLHNPFWAAMPVWVVNQAFREDLLIRGILRLAGTVVGAAIGYLSLVYVGDPMWQLVILALVVGLSTSVTYWIGTIYSYGPLIVGITAAVVMVPAFFSGSHMNMADIAHFAVDRIWCTLIGVVSVTVVTYLFTPARQDKRQARVEQERLKHAVFRGLGAGAATFAGTLPILLAPSVITLSLALSLAIFSSILGSLQDPRPVMRLMAVGVSLGVVAALCYRGILHWLDPSLLPHMVIAGLFIFCGAVLRSFGTTAIIGLDFNMCFLLAGEVGAEIHPLQSTAMGGIAMALAALAISQAYRLMPRHHVG